MQDPSDSDSDAMITVEGEKSMLRLHMAARHGIEGRTETGKMAESSIHVSWRQNSVPLAWHAPTGSTDIKASPDIRESLV